MDGGFGPLLLLLLAFVACVVVTVFLWLAFAVVMTAGWVGCLGVRDRMRRVADEDEIAW